ncbi:hypothetical protein [Pseudomonas aeruginosa]|nr:hypothetical protein [Pseudomonas aeruginosa]
MTDEQPEGGSRTLPIGGPGLLFLVGYTGDSTHARYARADQQ